jgi:hypothetical protein
MTSAEKNCRSPRKAVGRSLKVVVVVDVDMSELAGVCAVDEVDDVDKAIRKGLATTLECRCRC